MRPDAHTLLAAYAADALEPDDRDDVEAHLAECEGCRDDLTGYRETLGLLASASAEAPPARLRESVLERVRGTAQLPPLVPAATHPTPGAGSVPDFSNAPRGPMARRAEDRAPLSRSVLGLAAGFLAVLALGGGVYGWDANNRLEDVQAQQAAVQQVLAADDVYTAAGRPRLAGGVLGDEVVVLASRQADAALLLPAGLPAAPAGSTWQAWTISGEEAPVSAGVFDVSGGQAVALAGGLAGVSAVAITLEPSGGSSAPTTDPVLVVELA